MKRNTSLILTVLICFSLICCSPYVPEPQAPEDMFFCNVSEKVAGATSYVLYVKKGQSICTLYYSVYQVQEGGTFEIDSAFTLPFSDKIITSNTLDIEIKGKTIPLAKTNGKCTYDDDSGEINGFDLCDESIHLPFAAEQPP